MKFRFRTFELQDLHCGSLPVSIAFISVNINFEQPSFLLRNGRFHSGISHTAIPYTIHKDATGIDTVLWQDFLFLRCKIHCRKSKCSSKLLSMFHNTGDLIRIPQKLICKRNISIEEKFPDISAADLPVFVVCFLDHINCVAIFRCIFLQHLMIASFFMTKVKVRSDNNV